MTELEKWAKVNDDARTITEFLEFLNEKEYSICVRSEECPNFFMPTLRPSDELIYEMYGIDYKKLEQERRELLKNLQSQNNTRVSG